MPQTLTKKCELLLYADDSCILFQDKNIAAIEQKLNENFSNICDWFLDNKLSIHFGEDKTKCILFSGKNKLHNRPPLNINYNGIEIKQNSKVTYLGCILDESLNGRSMALEVLKKVNGKLRYLYRIKQYLTPGLKRLLCNALIQPHFDYACKSWYPFLTKNLQTKLQTNQYKCIKYCLSLESHTDIKIDKFKDINWLNVSDRFRQCVVVDVFKFINHYSPDYMAEIYKLARRTNMRTRNSSHKLSIPSLNTKQAQNCLSYCGPVIWNNLKDEIKQLDNLNTKLKNFISKKDF